MSKKLYAPKVDNYVDWLGRENCGGFNDNYTFNEESYRNIDKFFELIKRISPISDNGCRELWFCVDRGSIEDFGDYEEWLENGDVKNHEEFEEVWKDYYPEEKKWYNVQAVEDAECDYKAVVVNHRFVIVVNARVEKGDGHDISGFVDWLCTETEKCIEQIENGTYMSFVRENLPSVHKTGTILQKYLWELYPEAKEEFFNGISEADVADFINFVEKQNDAEDKVDGRLYSMTANDFYDYCAIGYSAMGYDIGKMTPKKQYHRFADGRDGDLSKIDPNSPEEFSKWLNDPNWHGAHPWEVCRGGNSTHIDLFVRCDKDGFYLALAGSSYGRASETIKFYLALCRAGLPVYLCDGQNMIDRIKGTEKVGVVPQGVIPRYCHSSFPNEDVISFMNLPYEGTEQVAEKCVWQNIREVHLLSEED